MKRTYTNYEESERIFNANQAGWRFITKINGKLMGIPPNKEAIDRNLKEIPV